MVKINKIYTRTGDDGSTGLVGGARAAKDSLKVASYGDVDELNSHLGYARTVAGQSNLTELTSKLATIQNDLFDLGSQLAAPRAVRALCRAGERQRLRGAARAQIRHHRRLGGSREVRG